MTTSIIDAIIIGSTNGSSTEWQTHCYNKWIQKVVKTITYPIYHILEIYNEDVGYDSRGRRAPYVESIDLFVWSKSETGTPIVYQYDLTRDYSLLRSTYTDKKDIVSLSMEPCFENSNDTTFSDIYDTLYTLFQTI